MLNRTGFELIRQSFYSSMAAIWGKVIGVVDVYPVRSIELCMEHGTTSKADSNVMELIE